MDFLFSSTFVEWIEAALAIVGAASAVAAATPTKRDDGVVGTIASVVNLLALNIGHARRP